MKERAAFAAISLALGLRLPLAAEEIPRVSIDIPAARAQAAAAAAPIPSPAPLPAAPGLAIAPAAAPSAAAAAPVAALEARAEAAIPGTAQAPEQAKTAQDGRFDGSRLGRLVSRLARAVLPAPAPRISAREALDYLNKRERTGWAERVSIGPEATVGLTEQEALTRLETLRGREQLFAGAQHIRNETYFVRIDGHLWAVVKKDATRSDFSFEGRVTHVRNNADMEPLAYVLDRFLGSNLVTPAISLGPGLSAQLRVAARDYPLKTAMRTPELYLDLSHMRLLDYLMVNYDRSFPGNLMRHNDNLFAIDFDLSKLDTRLHGAQTLRYFQNDEMVLPGNTRVAKGQAIPPVFLRGVVDQLRRLDEKMVDSLVAKAGIQVSAEKKAGLARSAREVVAMIDGLVAEYGESAIIVEDP